MIFRQFIKFSLVGIINTGIHYGFFFLLYRAFAVNYLAASVIGYCCGLLNSFILNRRWTFRSSNAAKEVEFTKFIIVNLAALGVNVASLKLLVESYGIKPEISQLGAIVFSLVVNFLGNKFWTFKPQQKRAY